MSEQRKLLVHLFNCDRTYKLDAVEGLLNATKAKLDFVPVVEKHYFSLAQMHEIATKTIPELKIDVAFFVVHAHESRLSINEDNAGIGYANIYRALMEATDNKVIIIIGGDDNYKNKDEEDRVVISRWARMKIQSQFKEEFLDGRKSFIFSWKKNHREIHEEALRHYFDPQRKGQKFEYQPKQVVKAAHASSEKAPLQKYQSMDDQRGREGIGSSNSSNAEQRRQDFASGSSLKSSATPSERTPLHRYHSMNDQPEEGIRSSSSSSSEQRRGGFSVGRSRSADETGEQSSFSSPHNAGQTRDDHSFRSTTGKATFDSEHGGKAKETRSASAARITITELAILGCKVSADSMEAVKRAFKEIGPKLNLAANPPVKNFEPLEVKQYLIKNHLKFCVLVVDAATVKDAYDNLDKRKQEYEDLLQTAAHEVDQKVLILMCDTSPLKSEEDDTTVRQTIDRIISKQGKGVIACLKNGKLSVEVDALVQLLTSTTPQGFQEKISDASGAAAESTYSGQSQSNPIQNPSNWQSELSWNVQNTQQPTSQVAATNQQIQPPVTGKNGEPVLLRTLLRYGKVSLELEDLQIWDPTFTVPEYISDSLLQDYKHIEEAGIRIVLGKNGEPECSVRRKLKEFSRKKEIQMEENETLLLKTRLLDGQASFQESDVHFRFGNWQIPPHIVEGLKEYKSTSAADLIISLKDGSLRCRVNIGHKDKIINFASRGLSLSFLKDKHFKFNIKPF